MDAYSSLFHEGIIDEIVLAGRKGWKMEDFLNGYLEEFLQHVHFTGFVDDEDLLAIYKFAKVFVFPSLYEGFGIPPLETLACGTPVISSDAASMPEVLGDNALYFHSNDVTDLRGKLYQINRSSNIVYENPMMKFNWKKSAGNLTENMN